MEGAIMTNKELFDDLDCLLEILKRRAISSGLNQKQHAFDEGRIAIVGYVLDTLEVDEHNQEEADHD